MFANLHEFVLRLKALFRRKQLERDMAEELEFHQSMLRSRLRNQGIAEAEMDAAARKTFGSSSRCHERLRELWQFSTLENLRRDLGYSARILAKSPGFTIVAVLTLTLGVGANTTVFSMINGILLRPLAVPQSQQLAVIGFDMKGRNINYSFPEPLFRGLEHHDGAFSSVFAFHNQKLEVKGTSGTESIPGQLVSGDFFTALETAPQLGRTLSRQDDAKGGNPAGFGVVLSDPFWQRWFNRAPNVVGQKLVIDNAVLTVVGVMPKLFIGADPLSRPQLFVPLSLEPVLDGEHNITAAGWRGWWLTVMGRMQPGSTLAQADADLGAATLAVARGANADAKQMDEIEKKHFRLTVENGSAGFTYLRMMFSKPLGAVFCMCGVVLLLACLNLASLLMARAAARQNELATRLALGATRQRLMQQLLVESLLISLIGTAAGLAIAPFVSSSLSMMLLAGEGDIHVDTSLDIRVFAFAALAAVAASLLVGLVPALQATSRSLNEQIKSGQQTAPVHERRRILPKAMMAGEVALALLLVVGAGLLASSLTRLYLSGTGFDPKGIQNISFSLDKQPLKGEATMQFYRRLGEGLRRVPGVSDVSFARMVPLTHWIWDEDMSAGVGETNKIYFNAVSPGYFKTMSIPLFSGRDFTWNDTPALGLKIVLNQSAAKLLFPNKNPVGEFVVQHDSKKTTQYQVVGVVGDVKYEDLRSVAPPGAYLPMTQSDNGQGPSYIAVVRTSGPAGPLAVAARSLAFGLQPGIPAPVTASMMSTIDDSLSAERTTTLLAVFFAVCALAVTAVGLYGTLAYATARRQAEIGIRMALGARRVQVAAMVFLQNAKVALAGTGMGLIAALLASRVLASFLYGTSSRDPWVFASSIVALALIASAASLLPALRSARIDPMSAIRRE